MTRNAEDFDRWYADRAGAPAVDRLVQRILGLPPELPSTSLLTWDALGEVVAALDLRDGQLLLDLACGRGGYGLEVAGRAGARVLGVDFSAVAIEQARQHATALGLADRAEFRVGELTRTGLAAGSVDAVLIVDAIQFADPALDALRECRRVLVPGGRLVITCWEAVDRADERVPGRMRQLDLAEQLPLAGFVEVTVRDRPEWRVAERALWQESTTIDAGDDSGLRALRDEGRQVLAFFDGVRRILATGIASN